MNVGIIGCGHVGHQRALAVFHHLGSVAKVLACFDIDRSKAEKIASISAGCTVTSCAEEVITHPSIDLLIIATTHDQLAKLSLAAINAGKAVLVEKPAARSVHDLEPLMQLAEQKEAFVHVGFNHRYHRAFQKAKKKIDELGELMFIRARYGHGGRLGYESEWRANPLLSGGGELIDQGVHLVDLSRWFLGDFEDVQGFAHTYFWDMPVEDNGFMLLKTVKKQAAFLHVSCTEWKNIFSMEIYGKKGKFSIDGLGGSYGVEKLTHYHMLPEMGPPETTVWEFPMADNSWAVELEDVFYRIKNNMSPASTLADAYASLCIVARVIEGAPNDCYA